MAQDTCPFHALLTDSTLDHAQRISIDLSESSFIFAQHVSRFAYLFSSHSLSKSSSLFSSGARKSEILHKSLNFSPNSILISAFIRVGSLLRLMVRSKFNFPFVTCMSFQRASTVVFVSCWRLGLLLLNSSTIAWDYVISFEMASNLSCAVVSERRASK